LSRSANPTWIPGTQLSRYEILSRLASGGMAEVWHARVLGVESFEKHVVLKTMRSELTRSEPLVRMFTNEATIAARMNHHGIVQIFDFGLMGGRHFIAMEHVAGRSLRRLGRVVRERHRRRLGRPLVLRLVAETARALAYAHGLEEAGRPLGFVHNDISPENIMVSVAGPAKLIDFGAASTVAAPLPTRALVGKLRYVAPERLREGVGDWRVDIYGLGVILYEYLTGRNPWAGTDLRARISDRSAPDPCLKVPGLPKRLGEMVRRALSPDPDRRYQDAGELADDLTELLDAKIEPDPLAASDAQVQELLCTPEDPEVERERQRPVSAPELGTSPWRSLGAPEAVDATPDSEYAALEIIEEDAVSPTPAAELSPVAVSAMAPATEPSVSSASPAAEPTPTPPPAPEPSPPSFSSPFPSQPRSEASPAERGADPFAIASRPRGPVSSAAAWFAGGSHASVAERVAGSVPGPEVHVVAVTKSEPPPAAPEPSRPAAANEAAALFEWGLAMIREQRLDEAQRFWEQAVLLDPGRRSYRVNLQRLQRQLSEEAARPSPEESNLAGAAGWAIARGNAEARDDAQEIS